MLVISCLVWPLREFHTLISLSKCSYESKTHILLTLQPKVEVLIKYKVMEFFDRGFWVFLVFLSPNTYVKNETTDAASLTSRYVRNIRLGAFDPIYQQFHLSFRRTHVNVTGRRRAFTKEKSAHTLLYREHSYIVTKAFSFSLYITGHRISSFQLLKLHRGCSCHLRCRITPSASQLLCMGSK